jgi:hypothetical protein
MTGEAKAMRQSSLKGYYIRHHIPFTHWDIESMSRAELDRKIKEMSKKYGKGQ